MKKFLISLIKPLIQEMVNEEIRKIIHVDPPKIKQIKIARAKRGVRITSWDALLMEPTEIFLCIKWITEHGIDEFQSISVRDLTDLKYIMKKIPETPPYGSFERVSIHVKIPGATTSIIENLVDTYDGHVYQSSDLDKVFKPVIEWLEDNSEYLI